MLTIIVLIQNIGLNEMAYNHKPLLIKHLKTSYVTYSEVSANYSTINKINCL
jgi:hypothetical protein